MTPAQVLAAMCDDGHLSCLALCPQQRPCQQDGTTKVSFRRVHARKGRQGAPLQVSLPQTLLFSFPDSLLCPSVNILLFHEVWAHTRPDKPHRFELTFQNASLAGC